MTNETTNNVNRHGRGSVTTTDHDTIRAWAERRDGLPVHVTKGCPRNDPSAIRIRLGRHADVPVEPIQWHEWFDRFEELRLAFVFRETTATGRPSLFNKLVPRRA